MRTIHTKSERATLTFAKKFARRLKGGDVVLLEGELGSGKTTFVRGLAAAFGIRERITSPTFVLLHIHHIRQHIRRLPRKGVQISSARASQICTPAHLVHVDAYRVKNARELKDIGLADWLGRPDTITVVEWGEKINPAPFSGVLNPAERISFLSLHPRSKLRGIRERCGIKPLLKGRCCLMIRFRHGNKENERIIEYVERSV